MDSKMKFAIFLAFILIIGAGVYAINTESEVPEKYRCETDADCVPETCCHASSCVNEDFAPNCTDAACTMECEPGTMDCGQGSCQCIQGRCKAVIEGESPETE
ncbi:MAG: hypothetical protein ACLFS3_03390 [Candidatus Aenigmatarchaeota archaeon]